MGKGKAMKKRIITTTLLLMLASVSVKTTNAQVFILSDEEYHSSLRGNVDPGILPIVPTMDVTLDQYAPLGGEMLLLGLLGGAYLLDKRRKREE